MSHETRITKLEKTSKNHEVRLNSLEGKFSIIINGIKEINDKLPKHPILNILSYVGAGMGIIIVLVFIIGVFYV